MTTTPQIGPPTEHRSSSVSVSWIVVGAPPVRHGWQTVNRRQMLFDPNRLHVSMSAGRLDQVIISGLKLKGDGSPGRVPGKVVYYFGRSQDLACLPEWAQPVVDQWVQKQHRANPAAVLAQIAKLVGHAPWTVDTICLDVVEQVRVVLRDAGVLPVTVNSI